MIITDCIIEMGFEAIKSKAISCENEKKIKQRLKSFIEHQYQVNTNCTLEEEIDFSKLAYYIYTELPKDVDVCLFGEKRERKRAQDVIIKKAISYAQANTLLSNERTVNMVESAFKIIRDFFRLQINYRFAESFLPKSEKNCRLLSSHAEKKELIKRRCSCTLPARFLAVS